MTVGSALYRSASIFQSEIHFVSGTADVYQSGDWSAEVGRSVEAAGYAAATTTEFGYEDGMPSRRFGLKRINIHNDVTYTPTLFAFHLAGYNNVR